MNKSTYDLKLAAMVGAVTKLWRRRLVPRGLSAPLTKPLTLITGGSGGIGAALAEELGAAGQNLLLIGQDEARLRSVAARVQAKGAGEVLSMAIDLSDFSLHETIDELLEAKGYHVEVLVNNAGLGERDNFLASKWEDLKRVVDVNIDVLTALTHHYLPQMVARGSGAVINMASLGGLAPGPYNSVYFASKAYVISLSEALANEVRGKGVYVAAILPGPTKTAFHHKINGQNSLYLKLFGQMRSREVARTVHRALIMGHWPVVTPGYLFSLIALFLRFMPGSLVAPLMGFLYKPRKFK